VSSIDTATKLLIFNATGCTDLYSAIYKVMLPTTE